MKYINITKIAAFALISFNLNTLSAQNDFEKWNTEINCEQSSFTITSFCQPSKQELTMNVCTSEQILAKVGQSSMKLPSAQTKAINKALRATHWECRHLNNVSYLAIQYAAGLGNTPNNEAVEYYELDLKPITDRALELGIIRMGKRTSEGYVRSIMPELGQSSPVTNDVIASPPSDTPPMAHLDWRDIVLALRDEPTVLTKSWPAFRRILPLGCFQTNNSDELSCPPIEGVKLISVVPGPLGIVDLVLDPPASCEAVQEVIGQRFGKAAQRTANACSAHWGLRRWVKGAYIDLRPSRKGPSLIRLQFAIEQGP